MKIQSNDSWWHVECANVVFISLGKNIPSDFQFVVRDSNFDEFHIFEKRAW